jgi:hypothetical protein
MIKDNEKIIIDFQDARMGIPQYDLVSLLEDCYYKVNGENKVKLIKYYYENLPESVHGQKDFSHFMELYCDMLVQRVFKALGSFAYIYKTRKDERYLKYIGFGMEKLRTTFLKHKKYDKIRKKLLRFIMRIDYCLILSAGFGTRMRSIGTKLPKPIWPIFEKSILELQIDYARMLGAKKVYVNLHFNHNQILNHFHNKEEYEDVHFLIEEEILDIGGGIHNLASQPEVNYKGRLMALNGDQFVFFDFKNSSRLNLFLILTKYL